jgi:hypothetical protein
MQAQAAKKVGGLKKSQKRSQKSLLFATKEFQNEARSSTSAR